MALQRVQQIYPLSGGASVNVFRRKPGARGRLSATLTLADGRTVDSPYTYGTLEDALAWARNEIGKYLASGKVDHKGSSGAVTPEPFTTGD
jgi:hypothetical protein